MTAVAKYRMAGHLLLLMTLCVSLNLGAASSLQASVVLAQDGKSDYTIVIPKTAPASVAAAAEELGKDIHLAAGAKLPIVTDDQAVTGAIISLGDTAQARAAGISARDIGDEGFRMTTRNGNLYILGPDMPKGKWTAHGGISNGTANGVYTFLQEQVGVRWLMPGDLGRDVPARDKLVIDQIDQIQTPMFSWRYVSQLSDDPAVKQWEDRQRLGTSWNLKYNHNWTWMGRDPSYYQAHPDWFAMDASGKRPPPARHFTKLETTNPELVKFFAAQAITALKSSQRPVTYSLSPSDNRGWSQSPESKALYDPSPSTIFDPEAPPGHPSMSSLILKWYHDVSQIVAREYPQGRLTGYIYADYLYPPKKVAMKLPDNFIPVIAPSFNYGYRLYRKDAQAQFKYVMDEWAKVAPQNWFYYDLPNMLLRQKYSDARANFPGSTAIVTPAAPDILNTIFQSLVRNHLKGAVIYGTPSWSNGAMANYILAQLMWNPKADAYALQRDWLERAYGPEAGAAMVQFYAKLNGWFAKYYQDHGGDYIVTRELLQEVYAAHFAEMEQRFLNAANRTMTPAQQQRLDLIRANLIVLQWRLRNAGLLPDSFASSLRPTDEQVIALLSKSSEGFEWFPGIVRGKLSTSARDANRSLEAALKKLKVQFTQCAPVAKGGSLKLGNSNFLIYTPQSAAIRVIPRRVEHGMEFASYVITNGSGRTIASGILNTGTPILFSAKAGHFYRLYLPPRNEVGFDLLIPNAAPARGRLDNGTLTLWGPSAAASIYFEPHASVKVTPGNGAVEIQKPGASQGAASGVSPGH